MDNETVGRRVRNLRKELGVSMAELARRTHLSQGQISRLENGRQGLRCEILARIAEVLDVNPGYFYAADESVDGRPGLSPATSFAEGTDLARALRSREFVRPMARLAHCFFEKRSIFAAIKAGLHAAGVLD